LAIVVRVSRTVSGVYRGVSAEERRASRREQLIAAALDLLGTEGWQATTVRAICINARLTPRYFYESFADLDALLVAVFDQIVQESAAAIMEAVSRAPRDARAKAHAAIGAFVGMLGDDPRKARVLFIEAMSSEALTRRRFDTLRMFAQLVAEQARDFYGPRSSADSLVDVAALMLVGGLAETLMAWLEGTLQVTQEQLVGHCVEIFVATGRMTPGSVI
jgi:AcrR family transcriptional regulator